MIAPRASRARLLPFAVVVCAVALVLPPQHARAQDEPQIPEAVGFVNDHAGLLDTKTHGQLEAFLDQVKQKTGAEFAILTVQTTAPLEPSEYKVRVFDKWQLGKKGEDNGLLMLVAVQERQVRFETGYGLEGTLPDGLQSRIFREDMQPRFRQGDFNGGIIAGTQRVAARIAAEKGVTLEWNGRELHYTSGRGGRVPWWVPFLIFMIVATLVSRLGGAPRRIGRRYYGGGWGGGFGGRGGGFGGGGGGSFGGFGGGSSGGGGGGGSW